LATNHSVYRLEGGLREFPRCAGNDVDVEHQFTDGNDTPPRRALEEDARAGAHSMGPPKPGAMRVVIVEVLQEAPHVTGAGDRRVDTCYRRGQLRVLVEGFDGPGHPHHVPYGDDEQRGVSLGQVDVNVVARETVALCFNRSRPLTEWPGQGER
jgi:hypothetical protein